MLRSGEAGGTRGGLPRTMETVGRRLRGSGAARTRHVGASWRRDEMGSGSRRVVTDLARLELQLAPSAHVTEEIRSTVVDAMTIGGLSVDGWLAMEGEAKPEGWPHHRIAPPHLYVVVSSSAEGVAERFVAAKRSEMGNALAAVRQALPSLPLGMTTVSPTRRRWWGFRPSETPEGIRQGMDALASVINDSVDALGWDGSVGAWVPM